MESERAASDTEMDEKEVQEDDEETQLLRDRFRLSAISIVEAEGFTLSFSLVFVELLASDGSVHLCEQRRRVECRCLSPLLRVFLIWRLIMQVFCKIGNFFAS